MKLLSDFHPKQNPFCPGVGWLLRWQVSKDGSQFVVCGSDSRLRVFRFTTGKLRRVYDESLEVDGWLVTVVANMDNKLTNHLAKKPWQST